ncbi:hypothetical protein U9M48_000653 [Paspalum notatum var. saurae]|uniref:Uncharacterized protein n=1 Tax=Paspalum notatum var. saurae TaxID=547442 RepID=A0AAQ3PIC7_PASNO
MLLVSSSPSLCSSSPSASLPRSSPLRRLSPPFLRRAPPRRCYLFRSRRHASHCASVRYSCPVRSTPTSFSLASSASASSTTRSLPINSSIFMVSRSRSISIDTATCFHFFGTTRSTFRTTRPSFTSSPSSRRPLTRVFMRTVKSSTLVSSPTRIIFTAIHASFAVAFTTNVAFSSERTPRRQDGRLALATQDRGERQPAVLPLELLAFHRLPQPERLQADLHH